MTQLQAIKKHLQRHNSITPLEALRKYGCQRLAARIWQLHEQGFSTVRFMVSRNGKRFAKYVQG